MTGFDKIVEDAILAATQAPPPTYIDEITMRPESHIALDVEHFRTDINMQSALVQPPTPDTDPMMVNGVNVMPAFNSPLDTSAITGPVTKDEQRFIVMKRWLQGYTSFEIAQEIQLSPLTIQSYITEARTEIRAAQQAELLTLSSERVAGFSLVKSTAWAQYDLTKNSRWLQIVLRAEELISKLQGVLTDKMVHTGDIEIIHKLYDFKDDKYRAIEVEFEVHQAAISDAESI